MNHLSAVRHSRPSISSFEHIDTYGSREAPVVTMFSGGLDSTYLLLRLQELGFKNIEAVAVDVGEPISTENLRRAAAHFGASFNYLDGRRAFIEHGVKPAIRAHARYLGNYPLSSSLSRPVIASVIAEHASAIGSKLLLHTANRSQNSLPRLNNGIARSDFVGAYGSPYELSVTSRQQKAAALADVGLTFMAGRLLSGDENLWCREFESGPLDDPEEFRIPEEAFRWTKTFGATGTTELKLGFEDGDLVSIDGADIELEAAIASLNEIVGRYGHGRYVGLEHIASGEKVLEVREAPAALIIMDALRHLEVASLSTESLVLKQRLEQDWVQEAVCGRWRSTVHTMCERALGSALEGVGGTVTYRISAQRMMPRSIVAHFPRYIRDRDLWEYASANRSLGNTVAA